MTAIRLVISDVDGTLVTSDKRLTPASIEAVAKLRARGIGFTIVSSRPPIGLKHLIAPLAIDLPVGAFNGGMIVAPDLAVIEQRLIPEAAARASLGVLAGFGVEPWLYTADQWIVRSLAPARVPFERRTIQADPVVADDLEPYLARLGKIVGVSDDHDRLAECELAMQKALGQSAFASRSQRYYLDVTPPGVDKGTFVAAMARRLALPREAVAVLGDMANDLPMFREAGLAVAMGNAVESVRHAAQRVTGSNDDDGFAAAIDQVVLAA